jgi:hypothetical protein
VVDGADRKALLDGPGEVELALDRAGAGEAEDGGDVGGSGEHGGLRLKWEPV